jgi:GTPase SAR1 family protein
MASFLYNPDRKPKTELIAEFVVRTEIYDEIMHDLETSAMDHPEQHYLLVGQRGAGKTTLLNRIKYGIEDSKVLKHKVIPIIFSEEQYNISELANLWESIAQTLEDYHGFEGLYEEMEAHQMKDNFEETAYELLEKQLKKSKKKLVLLVDNIGDMMKKLEKTEVHRLRELLQTKSEIRLIAGSPFYLETVLDYQQPLFEFFKVLRLDGLNEKETQHLLKKLGEINDERGTIEKIISETPERIETLRTLTGGVPRTIALMFNIFVQYNNEDVVKDLEKILDAVTPLYKHRMDDLPTQQQKIVDAVARNWDGISVKELKDKIRIESKTISAQLRQLEKNQIIERVQTKTKNHIYFLKERFFNIWYLMRYGRKYDRQRVIWLVKFLESWCSASEIEQRILDYVAKLEKGKLDEQLISFYGEVYTAMNSLRAELKIALKEATPIYLSKRINIDEKDLLRIINEKIENKEYKRGFQLIEQLDSASEQSVLPIMHFLMKILKDDAELFIQANEKILQKISDSKELSLIDIAVATVFFIFISMRQLFNREFKDAHEALKALFILADDFKGAFEPKILQVLNNTITNFLAFDQANTVYLMFKENPSWKDKLKPTYYATIIILQLQEEVIKMGSELTDSVKRVLEEVKIKKQELKSKFHFQTTE